MKNRSIVVVVLAAFTIVSLAAGQTPAPAPPPGEKTLAATMNVYVFPTKGQNAPQQSEDESGCYAWAVQNSGADPFELQKQAKQQQEQAQQQQKQAEEKQKQAQAAGKGAGAKGAVAGAAAGALIGEITDHDASAAAGYGAAGGAVVARRRAKAKGAKASEQAKQESQQAQQQAQQAAKATQEQIDNFKKAFSVCLEAKNYMVKY